jgi:hypothetical protein
MKHYFNGQTKDSEEYGERTFIIDPQFTNNWRDIYLSRFRESYSLGMKDMLKSTRYGYHTYLHKLEDNRSSFSNSDAPSKFKEVFVYGHLCEIVTSEHTLNFSAVTV